MQGGITSVTVSVSQIYINQIYVYRAPLSNIILNELYVQQIRLNLSLK